MHTFIFLSWSLSCGWWECCSFCARGKKNMRMCDTWKLATCFAAALNSELMCVSEEMLTRTGVNRACTQSLFLQPVEATDRLSRTCMISQLWPDWQNQRTVKQQANVAVIQREGWKLSSWLTRSTSLICFTCYFCCLFYFNASMLPVR